MENQIVEVQEAPKTMMMQRKSRVQERVEEDEAELKELLAEQEGTEVEAKEDAEPANAEEKSYKKRYADLRRGSQKAKEDLSVNVKPPEGFFGDATFSMPKAGGLTTGAVTDIELVNAD